MSLTVSVCLLLGTCIPSLLTLWKQLPAVAEIDAVSEEKLNQNSVVAGGQLNKELKHTHKEL